MKVVSLKLTKEDLKNIIKEVLAETNQGHIFRPITITCPECEESFTKEICINCGKTHDEYLKDIMNEEEDEEEEFI